MKINPAEFFKAVACPMLHGTTVSTYRWAYIHTRACILSRFLTRFNLSRPQGYKVYYTTDPNQQMASWQYQLVDNSQLTTISDLTPHTIYMIRVQALTSVGPGPLSTPVQIKTQQGVPSQPEMLTAVDIGETKVTLQWNKPTHSAENILSYELYWNDTYAQVGNSLQLIPRLPISKLSVNIFLIYLSFTRQVRSIYVRVWRL